MFHIDIGDECAGLEALLLDLSDERIDIGFASGVPAYDWVSA